MKNRATVSRHRRAAFTLVELLTVIAIIAILAAMILPAVTHSITAARKMQAKSDMQGIVAAIESYDQDYGRFPVSTNEQAIAAGNDFTTGAVFGPAPNSYDSNSNVVAILMDMQTFPFNGAPTPDYNHVKNPKQVKYLNAKLSGYNPVGASPTVIPPPGVDQTGIYRDPWGEPYVITMDLNYDDQCSDIIYSQAAVSSATGPAPSSPAGLFGLSNPGYTTNANNFQYPAKVMVWSAGPDRKYDNSKAANTDVNKDNLLSWQ